MNQFLNDAFFSRLETLALKTRPNLGGFFGGKHLVKTYGQTVEFADYREYSLGDDLRRIDWNLYSRFEKFFIKLFTDERQMHVQIFLDCSASMGMNPQKGHYAISTAAALGYLAVHNTDKVTFNLIKGGTAENQFGKIVGKQAFFRAVSELEKIKFEGEADFAPAITRCETTGTNDGLTVIISDFFTDSDWKKAVKFLKHKKHQVLLIQILTPEEVDPDYMGRSHLIDVETSDILDERNMRLRITRSMLLAYEDVIREIFEDMRHFSVAHDVDYVSVRTNIPIEKMLFGELLKVGVIA